ncbi:MAG TPA: ATPase, T2SS/T4P/T4SS family, partial [Brevundimonas sp.]|nr:ATPase, T2SS/T4P/T4SS family [Brevundimonas sp.]
RSSMTGHLVLSTLHTNSAVGSVTRLVDMGVERYLLAPMLTGLIAQRLVRRLCPTCRQESVATAADAELTSGAVPVGSRVFQPVGCQACRTDGYRGRTGLYEVIEIDPAFQAMVHDGASEADLVRHARTSSRSILDDGAAKVASGQTSVAEVVRVVREDG